MHCKRTSTCTVSRAVEAREAITCGIISQDRVPARRSRRERGQGVGCNGPGDGHEAHRAALAGVQGRLPREGDWNSDHRHGVSSRRHARGRTSGVPRLPGHIDDRATECLVQRTQSVPPAGDVAARSKCSIDGSAERQGAILRAVMIVDVQVAAAVELDVNPGVPGQRAEHVVEEANACGQGSTAVLPVRLSNVQFLRQRASGAAPVRMSAEPLPSSRTSATIDVSAVTRSSRPARRRACDSVVAAVADLGACAWDSGKLAV